MKNTFMNRVVSKFTEISSFQIAGIITFSVLPVSIFFVYIATYIAGREYSSFLFTLSTVLPLVLTPAVVFVLIKLTKHLQYYKKHLEEEIVKNKQKDIILYEQARFVLMGEMIANISHQWKQPLNTINLAVLEAKFADKCEEEKVEKTFEIIEANVSYLANTINDFLSFFDKKSSKEKKSLKDIIAEVKSISYASLKMNNIELRVESDEKSLNVLMASSISQVILNLISNARDALEEVQDKREVVVTIRAQECCFKIACCDSGKGVETSIVDKVFDPYFTTKDKSRGTGLGLYMSKQIIHTIFNGNMFVQKENPSCFVVEVPYGENCILEKR